MVRSSRSRKAAPGATNSDAVVDVLRHQGRPARPHAWPRSTQSISPRRLAGRTCLRGGANAREYDRNCIVSHGTNHPAMAQMHVARRTLVVALTVVLVSCSAAEPRVSGADDRNLPADPPAGTRLCHAAVGLGGEPPPVTIWGDVALPDAWMGPVAWASLGDGKELAIADQAKEIRIRGAVALIAPLPLFQGVSAEELGFMLTRMEHQDKIATVRVRGSRSDAIRAAERLTFSSKGAALFAPDALGKNTRPIAEGSGLGLIVEDGFSRWFAHYGSIASRPVISIRAVIVSGDVMAIARFFSYHSEPVEMSGWRGVLYSALSKTDRPWGVILKTGDTTVLQVIGATGVTRDQVASTASSVRRVAQHELDLSMNPACPTS